MREPARQRSRTLGAAATGVLTAVVVGVAGRPALAPLAGWDAAAAVYLIWLWADIWRLDADATARIAVREEPGRVVADLAVFAAALASLAAIVAVLISAGSAHGLTKGLEAGFGAASIVISWLVVHSLFTLRYAQEYFLGEPGGIEFPGDDPPRYRDLAYVAFTVGMTFQVSDTALGSSAMRAIALRHALVSYLFGTVILALTVNLVAGLGH